jgi:N-acetylmuramoyl-L-alanine amidase
MKKIRKKHNNQKTFLFPIFALFSLTICVVVAMIIVGGDETIDYLRQLNFVPDEKTVCIDPGHGGNSSGAVLGERFEKDDTLRLSLLVSDILEDRGYTVVMTRDDDSDVSLAERCKIANKARASLFVSIHRNSSSSSTATGVEMWVHSSNPTDDNLLAQNILDSFDTLDVMTNRGIHTGYRDGEDMNYYINRNTKMPSVLAEIGFISNKEDNEKYDNYLNDYAKAIADGIQMTLKEMNGE